MNNEVIKKISDTYGTPFYLYDESVILEKIRKIKKAFNGLNFHPTFAVKANGNPALLKLIAGAGMGMDIITPGEMKAALMAGVSPADMVWNGCGKTIEEMNTYLDVKIGKVNIDSTEELELWAGALKNSESDYQPDFYIRINPEVSVMTHRYISTGLKKHKFGVPVDMADDFFKKAKKLKIKISGIHSHIGSQITDVIPFYQAFYQIAEVAKNYKITKINIGGGFGINYTGEEIDLGAYRKKMLALLKPFDVTAEFGRYIVADAGYYVTRVNIVKWNGFKHFVVTDGGMNHLIRPALYGAIHEFDIIGEIDEKFETDYNIVGPLCESGDMLYLNWHGNLPLKGALINFKNTGAYGYSMASNYNSTLKPAELLFTADRKIKLIRKRETFKELFGGIVL